MFSISSNLLDILNTKVIYLQNTYKTSIASKDKMTLNFSKRPTIPLEHLEKHQSLSRLHVDNIARLGYMYP